ncbi:MAG TPA: GNAT family N-acetyltransferase [Acidimicrobiales bacterium]|nr:GNAT family N-acetyltransferase [Acidimicrobiales bacterium]
MTEIVRIDPNDSSAFDEWFTVLHATDLLKWPDRPGWQRAERLAQALDEDGPEEHCCLVARGTNGTVQGIADFVLFRRENHHVARVEVGVLPGFRRQGVGTAVVEAAARMAADAGRRELGGMDESPDRPGYFDAAAPFARRLGFSAAQRMVRRQLSLPLSHSRTDALLTRAKAKGPDYTMITFADRWPDRFVADRCVLGRRMSTDIPLGDQELEEEVWDEDRVRHLEAGLVAQNRARVTTAALHQGSGHLVAFTEVEVPLGAPESAWQHDTLVLREHRGHGLGLAMKVINATAVQNAHPGVRTISTWNAGDNRHMIAVNEEIGFVAVATSVYWLKKLDTR